VQRVTSTPTFDPRRRTWTGVHAVPGHWVAEANPGDTGGTVEAIRRLLGPRMSLARFDALAASAPYRTEQVMALFGPRVLNMSNPGMSLGGLITPVPITYDGIDAGTVARATLENVAFAIRECLALLDDVAPASHAPLALTGGMAASPVFTTILADTLGRVVRVHGPRAAGTGAALIASRPPREWASAAGEIARHGAVVEPDASRSLERGERYEHWRQMKARLDALAEEL
jgi:sugar (pentulose or hexulose) kinase